MKLRVEEDEVEDELSGLEKGTLLHKVLFTFYDNRRAQGDPPIEQCDETVFEEAKRRLDVVLNAESEKYRRQRSESPIGEKNLFWETDIEKLRVALHKWLETERTYDLRAVPRYFEVNFGQAGEPEDSRLSTTESICISDVRMKGKIDRINIDNGTFSIVDYKTGSSTIRMPEILNGRSLQLPIYLQIAKELLEKHNLTELNPAAGLYYKIRLDQFTSELGIGKKSLNGHAFKEHNAKEWKAVHPRNGQLLEDESFSKILARIGGYVQQYVASISEGNFPLITRVGTFVDSEEKGDAPITPKHKTEPCNYCNYKRLCRVGAISEGSQSDD